MSWTCQCAAINADGAAFCGQCHHPFIPASAPPPPPPPAVPFGAVPPPRTSSNGLGLKIGAVAGVLLLGVIFGTLVAEMGSNGSTATDSTARSTSGTDVKSMFQQSFDSSFERSCRVSALRGGKVTQDAADRYCDCALRVLHETHSMTKVVERCRQYVVRPY
jgi:hypothetical protein